MKKKIFGYAAAAVLAMGMLAGCGSSDAQTKAAETTVADTTVTDTSAAETTKTDTAQAETTQAPQTSQAPAELSGSVSMVGSTSMEKFANALSEVFMEKYPKVTLQAEFVGSGAGVEAAANGTAQIGNASRNLKDEEKAKGVVENIVAIDGIAVVVDKENAIEDLTKEQLMAIYSGEITNWKDVGGSDAPIVVVGREAGSGTRGAFEEILKLEEKCKYSNELDSTGAVMAKIGATKGAIGYVSLDVINDTVKAVKLEGVEPSADNIKSGSYFLSRPFVMATKGEIAAQDEVVKEIFAFIYSDEGSQLIESVGLIPAE